MSESKVIISTFTSLLILCATILIIYFWNKLSKLSHLLVVKKRHMPLIHIELTLLIIYLLLERLLMTIEITFNDSNHAIFVAIRWTHLIIYAFTFHGVLLLIVLRIYHMYYDLNYNQISESSQWKTILNPTLKLQQSWFIQNKYKYGSWLYTLRYIVLPIWIIDSIYGCIVYIAVTEFNVHSIAILFYEFPYHIVSNILIWLIYRKIPTHYDTIYIKIEFKQTCIAYTTFFVVIGGIYTALLFSNIDKYTRRIVDIISYVCGAIALVSPTIITIPAKIERQFNTASHMYKQGGKKELSTVVDLFRSKRLNRQQSNSSSNSRIDLNQIFKYEHPFNEFMMHLQREMSTECLLCFVELMQFKIAINNVQNTNSESPLNIAIIGCFYEQLPHSEIVAKDLNKLHEMDDLVKLTLFTQKYSQLYEKYIRSGAELEVNISYKERQKQVVMMHNINTANVNLKMSDLKGGFDGIVLELHQLMSDPFTRFKSTSKYADVCDIINNIK